MNIIGLGKAGCAIADSLGEYPQYKKIKIDVDISGKGCYTLPTFENAEDYENYDYPKLKSFLKDLKGQTTFVLAGSGTSSCASLRILEHLKRLPISILYIQPDLELLTEKQNLQERVVFHVLQEYARSGVFEEMCIVSNTSLDDAIGGAPILGYYEKLNEILINTIHMINIFRNSEPVLGNIGESKQTHRIFTVGIFDPKKDSEKMLFSLDNARERCYIYGINEDKLKTDTHLLSKLKKQINSKSKENLTISYAVYSTEYDNDIGYIIEKTPHPQQRKKLT